MIGYREAVVNGYHMNDYITDLVMYCTICGKAQTCGYQVCDKCVVHLGIEGLYGAYIDFNDIKTYKDIPQQLVYLLSLKDAALLYEIDPTPYEKMWADALVWYGYVARSPHTIFRTKLLAMRKQSRLNGNVLFRIEYSDDLPPVPAASTLESLLFGEG